MNNFTRLLAGLAIISAQSPLFAQSSKEMNPGYYVVVAAYSANHENIAQNYTEVLTRKGINAAYGFNTSRNLYYVYLQSFTDLKSSLTSMQAARRQSDFVNAWVRVIAGDLTAPTVASQHESTKPVERSEEVVAKAEPVKNEVKPAITTQIQEEKTKSEPASQPVMLASISTDNIIVTDNPEIKQFKQITLGNTEVFLSLFNLRNNRIVDGDVKVIDTERSRVIKEVKGNEYLVLPNPNTKSGKLTLICEAFGYRKIQQEINYHIPLGDTVKEYIDLMGTTFVVNFDLVRYQKGDIGTLFHVYFYNDAALMLPESKYELNGLVQMMEENPRYRIMLHGHSNGNYHGKIISMGPEKNFFSLDGSVQGLGSAKDLSRQRAETIKEYLIANGIDGSRVEIKSWGGKKPIYDRHSVNAKRNVRVEVEILDE